MLGSSAFTDISIQVSFRSPLVDSRHRRVLPLSLMYHRRVRRSSLSCFHSFFVFSTMFTYPLSLLLSLVLLIHIFSLSLSLSLPLCNVTIYTAMIARIKHAVHQVHISQCEWNINENKHFIWYYFQVDESKLKGKGLIDQ